MNIKIKTLNIMISWVILLILFSPTVNAEEFDHFMGINVDDERTYVIERESDENGYFMGYSEGEPYYLSEGDRFKIRITDPVPFNDPMSITLGDIFPITQFQIKMDVIFDNPANPGNELIINRQKFIGFGELVSHVNWSAIDQYYDMLSTGFEEAVSDEYDLNRFDVKKSSDGSVYELKMDLDFSTPGNASEKIILSANIIHEKSTGFLLYSNLYLESTRGEAEINYQEIREINFDPSNPNDDNPLDYPVFTLGILIIIIPLKRRYG